MRAFFRKTIKIWTLLPSVIIMIVIFLFSAQDGLESGSNSSRIVSIILWFFQRFGGTPSAEMVSTIGFLVRKTAHFCIYALLAFVSLLHAFASGRRGIYTTVPNVIFCAVYAATDELHQRFVPGRSGQATDVLLDTAGAITGTAAAYLVLWMVEKRRLRRLRKTKETGFGERLVNERGV